MINPLWPGHRRAPALRRGGMALLVPAALTLSVALALGLQRLYWPFVVDDAYISLTYARNLGDGLGLVHNQGLRVEGFSNLLWVLLLAPFRTMGFDLPAVAKLGGSLLALGTLGLVSLLASQVAAEPATRRTAAIVCPLLLAASPAFALWSVSGLETPLFAFLILLGLLLLIGDVRRPGRGPRSPWAFAALSLTRPEGFVFSLAALLWLLLLRRFGPPPARPAGGWIARWSLIALAPPAGVTLFRLVYYGQWLPNTVYVKAGGDLLRQSLRGLQYLYRFSNFAGYIVLLPALPWGLGRARRQWPLGLVAFVAAAYLAFIVAAGGDWMPYFRFFAPILPLLFIVLGPAIIDLTQSTKSAASARPSRRLPLFLLAGVLCLAQWLAAFDGLFVSGVGLARRGPAGWIEFIKTNAAPGDIVAVVDAGQIGYETDLRLLDMVGLLDPHIARLNPVRPPRLLDPATGYGYGKWDVDYILAADPAFIQAHVDLPYYRATGGYRSDWLGTDALLGDPRFLARYRLVEVGEDALFVRRDRLIRPEDS